MRERHQVSLAESLISQRSGWALPHRCLLSPLCNWDAETLTELIYCNWELCNVEGNTDYCINAHTHTQWQADMHMLVKENVIWHHVWRPSSIVLQDLCLRWAEVKTCRVIASCTVGVCAQVFIMRFGHQQGYEGLAIEMELFCCLMLWLWQQITHLNKKTTTAKLKAENVRICWALLLCHSLTLPLILPASERQRKRFILLRQRTSLTCMRTLFHTHTHTQEHRGLLSYTSH